MNEQLQTTLEKRLNESFKLVSDRLEIGDGAHARLKESLELGMKLGKGTVVLNELEKDKEAMESARKQLEETIKR